MDSILSVYFITIDFWIPSNLLPNWADNIHLVPKVIIPKWIQFAAGW